jgi:hypothetical protein
VLLCVHTYGRIFYVLSLQIATAKYVAKHTQAK